MFLSSAATRFSVLKVTEGERITNQMDDAGLDLTVRINRANSFGIALQAIDHCHQRYPLAHGG